jgi:nitrogenase molybdenum-iron protein beta chain
MALQSIKAKSPRKIVAPPRNGVIEQPRYACGIGAMQSVSAIRRAIPVTHCGPGCAVKQTRGIAHINGYQGAGWAGSGSAPSSNLQEREVIFGGAERLQQLIDASLEIIDADAYVVLTGCIPDLVGDDVASVVSSFRKRGAPVVLADTGGFRTNNFVAHETVTKALIDQYVGDASAPTHTGLVNVWSLLPYQNTFWRGDLTELKRLLEGVGLEANVLFGPASRGLSEWKRIPQAQFNLVVSPWLGLATARHLEEKFGQPFLHIAELPVGGEATSAFLREVGAYAGLSERKVEDFIAAEEEIYYHYIDGFAELYAVSTSMLPAQFAIVGDSAYALGLTRFLSGQLGLIPARQIVTDNPPFEHRPAIDAAFARIDADRPVIPDYVEDGFAIQQLLRETDYGHKPPLLYASGWERALAKEIKATLIQVASPTNGEVVLNRANIGYRGALTLIERTYSAIMSPVS